MVVILPYNSISMVILLVGGVGYWKMYGKDPRHIGVQPLRGGMTYVFVKWKKYLGSRYSLNIHGSPVICNLTNSYAGGEVVVKTTNYYSNKVFAFAGTNGALLWSKTYGSGAEYATPACGDLNGDGLDDVVIRTSTQLVALRGRDGRRLWYRYVSNLGSSPVVADVVPTFSGPEVIYIEHNSSRIPVLYVLRGSNGQVIWSRVMDNSEYVTSYDGQPAYSTPAVWDIDGDGTQEIVVKTRRNGLRAYNGRTGALEWIYPISTTTDIQTPSLKDLNGDGRYDVVFTDNAYGPHDQTLKAVNHNGSLLWSLDLGRNIGAIGFQYFATLDVDASGRPEIFLGWDQHVYRIDQTGTSASVSWDFGPEGNSCWDASLAAVDYDHDGRWEVIKTCDGDLSPPGRLRIFDTRNGNVEYSRIHGCYTDPSVAVGDVDGDGCSEIVMYRCVSYVDSLLVLDGPLSNCGILSELGDLSTGEAHPKHAEKVWEVVGRSLVLKGKVAVWGADGRLVGRYGPGKVSLQPGIYFLTYGGGRAKVVIR